jgi:hypothetical protein
MAVIRTITARLTPRSITPLLTSRALPASGTSAAVLDLGCSVGRLMLVAALCFPLAIASEVIGIDCSQRVAALTPLFIQQATHSVRELSAQPILPTRVVCADFCSVSSPTTRFIASNRPSILLHFVGVSDDVSTAIKLFSAVLRGTSDALGDPKLLATTDGVVAKFVMTDPLSCERWTLTDTVPVFLNVSNEEHVMRVFKRV